MTEGRYSKETLHKEHREKMTDKPEPMVINQVREFKGGDNRLVKAPGMNNEKRKEVDGGEERLFQFASAGSLGRGVCPPQSHLINRMGVM